MPRFPALAGIHEIADMAGVSRQRAFQITSNRGFPEPVAELRCGRIWRRDDVAAYLAGRGSARPDEGGGADTTTEGASPHADPS